ncbi:MAG: hypothetical protein KY468_21330 [Armatimonadetes bacterium]|nr:hypothetical protein [Armatimonadota bacterium]
MPLTFFKPPLSGEKRSRIRSGVLLFGLALALTPSWVQAQTPVKLRYQLRPGDQYTYIVNVSGRVKVDSPDGKPIPPVSFTGRIRQERTVMRALSNGGFMMGDRVASGVMKMSVMGQTQTVPVEATPVQYTTVNALGRMTLSPDQKMQMRLAGAQLGFDPSELIAPFATLQAFPMEAVAPGSKWQRTAGLKLPPHLSLNVVVNNKLTRITTLANRRTAEVASTIRLPLNIKYADARSSVKINGGLSGAYRSNYALVSGMPVRMGGTFGGTILLQGKGGSFRGASLGKANGNTMTGKLHLAMTVSMHLIGEKQNVDPSTLASAKGSGSSSLLSMAKRFPSMKKTRSPYSASMARASLPAARTTPSVSAPAITRPYVPAAEPSVQLYVPTKSGVVPRGEVALQALSKAGVPPPASAVFTVNGERVFVTNSAPYRFLWDTTDLPAGVYTLGVEVNGERGQVLYRSPARRVKVAPAPADGESPRMTEAGKAYRS